MVINESSLEPRALRQLAAVLRLVGAVSLLAFAAALMPSGWIVEIAEALGLTPFPDHPLTFYLARHLSLLYGFVGALLLLLAADLPRYVPLVRWAAAGTVLLGGLQGAVDAWSGMPTWWTWGESLSSIAGGLLLGWLQHRCRAARSS